ncbi:MAG: SPOR domain-containing protein [Paludibacteraceae bacterium]|nr:SPOR domain-containing protein [Paludibacteraceae bacterium]MBO7317037.1 SPOR domain-containing protein [Paludibacteraceae bacterium]
MRSMYKLVVVFFAIILFVGCASKKGAYQANEAPKEIIKEVEVIKIDTVVIIKTDTIIKTEFIEKHDTIYIEKEVEEKVREEKITLAEGEKNQETMTKAFHIVIGSFSKKENADKLQASYRPAYEPTIVVNEQGMFRVLLLSFDDYASAKKTILEISKNIPTDSWILRQKK